ncbi:MAG: cytochrome c oxidase subunit II [Beijerinckiaceae bacterium]|nr:cytochrome c oxidase subunit II [Beijerinckiaceae bacterium]
MLFQTKGSSARRFLSTAGAAAAAWAILSGAAWAQFVGAPRPHQVGLPEAASPIMREMVFFHDAILLPIITVISLFVLGLIVYVVSKFNENANPTPSRTTHHTGLEVAWTIIPVVILLVIAIPSFRLLNHQLTMPDADMTLKVTGNSSWAWTWTYPKGENGGGFEFQSRLLDQATLPADKKRLLDVDNEAVVPVNKTVRLQVTADVVGIIHAFALPNLGVRIDAIPGRLNETWFRAEKEGVYYGQCSELCGKDHAYMPIVLRVVSEDAYKAWLASASKQFASNNNEPVRVADAATAR